MELAGIDQRGAGRGIGRLHAVDPEHPAALEAVAQLQRVMVVQIADQLQGRAVIAMVNSAAILAEKLVKGDIIDRQMIFGHSFLHSCSSFLHRYVQKGLL